jgi:antitoxin VapB
LQKISALVEMALNIKDPKAEQVVRELAALTGESVTAAVRRAAEERLQRVRRRHAGRNLAEELMEIGRHCASLPDFDTRSADEILGYDENGLPT